MRELHYAIGNGQSGIAHSDVRTCRRVIDTCGTSGNLTDWRQYISSFNHSCSDYTWLSSTMRLPYATDGWNRITMLASLMFSFPLTYSCCCWLHCKNVGGNLHKSNLNASPKVPFHGIVGRRPTTSQRTVCFLVWIPKLQSSDTTVRYLILIDDAQNYVC